MALGTIEAKIAGWVETSEIPEIREALNTLINDDPSKLSDALKLLRDSAVSANEEVRSSLTQLISDIEAREALTNGEYTMEYLREHSDGFLGKLLDIELVPGVDVMKGFLLQQSDKYLGLELLNIIPSQGKENFQILIWNKIVQSMWLSSLLRHGANSFMGGIQWIFSGAKEGLGNATQDGLSMDDLGQIAESFRNFGDGEQENDASITLPAALAVANWGNAELKVPSGVVKGLNYLDSLTQGYFQNMKKLLELAKSQWMESSEAFKSFLSHPQLLQELLENGKVNQDGFDIDLNTSKIVLWSLTVEQIETSGKEMISKILGDTNSLSGKIDSIMAKTDQFAKWFEQLGFDAAGIEELKQTLFSIPIIGAIFKILFGDFLSGISSRIESMNLSSEIKKAVENATAYILKPENKEKLPFKVREEDPGKLSEDETSNFTKFLKKLKKQAKEDGIEDDAITALLQDTNLTQKLFTGEGIPAEVGDSKENALLSRTHKKITEISSAEDKPTQEEFFKKLKDINLEAAVPVETDRAEIAPVPALTEQLAGMTGFPATIIQEVDGARIETEIKYDAAGKRIMIGDKSYTLTELHLDTTSLLGTAFNFESLVFADNTAHISLNALSVGEWLIATSNLLNGDEPDIELDANKNVSFSIESDTIRSMIAWLINTGTYTHNLKMWNAEKAQTIKAVIA